MSKAQSQEELWENDERVSETLRKNIEQLQKRGKETLQQRHGCSEVFSRGVITPEIALSLCDHAMERLATDYVHSMQGFKEAKSATSSLEALEEAEVIWQAEASLIRELDAEGGEVEFLQQIREMAYQVLESRLESVAALTSRKTSKENVALCLAILAVMDQIRNEQGVSETDPLRRRFREVARGFI